MPLAGAEVGKTEEFSNSTQSPLIVELGESFTFTLPMADDGDAHWRMSVGACTGTIDGPKLKADNQIYFGVNVSCAGTGFLPLYAQAILQEEHLGTFYQDVGDTGKQRFSEGGFGYAGASVPCGNSSGHDYRVKANITAGEHEGFAVSREIHLPCNV